MTLQSQENSCWGNKGNQNADQLCDNSPFCAWTD